MRFGLFVPAFAELADPRRVADLAHTAEESGWEGFYLWDHVLRPGGTWINLGPLAWHFEPEDDSPAREGGTAPCVLNAANEVAVHSFLEGHLRFLEIPAVIERTLSELPAEPVRAFESLYDADRLAREVATRTVAALH